jgi:hypothetical protein
MMPVASVDRWTRLGLSSLAVVLTSATVVGCGGEPEPFRSKDPAQARAAMLKKSDDLGRPPGLPKGSRSR